MHNTVNRGTVLHTQSGSPWKGVEDTEVRKGMMNWYLVLLFSFLGSKKKVPVENKTWSNAEMDWDNEQICHW